MTDSGNNATPTPTPPALPQDVDEEGGVVAYESDDVPMWTVGEDSADPIPNGGINTPAHLRQNSFSDIPDTTTNAELIKDSGDLPKVRCEECCDEERSDEERSDDECEQRFALLAK